VVMCYYLRMRKSFLAFTVVAGLCAMTSSQVRAQELFDTRFRSALQESSGAAIRVEPEPPLGSSERVEYEPSSPQPSVSPAQPQPYIDLTNGLVAAGGAIFAAFMIVFLFFLVIRSRHHEIV
jgi:hypothetical protein